LLQNRAGRNSTNWSGLGFLFAILFGLIISGLAAFVVRIAVDSGERAEAERQGKIVVSSWFLDAAREAFANSSRTDDQSLPTHFYTSEAKHLAERYGGTETEIERKLRNAARNHGAGDFITNDEASPGFVAFPRAGPMAGMLGSMVLIWWAVMLVFQGEGLEMDIQHRRHPMWEWLFTHPVPTGAVFLAEMLSPLAANPAYWGAPLFVGILYGFIYGQDLGILAGLLLGIPLGIGAACLGKALEIGVTLRFSPRSRGAMIGLMSWMGYASMVMLFVGLLVIPKIVSAIGNYLSFLTVVPWPWLKLFVGGQLDGSFSFLSGLIHWWIVTSVTIAGAV
jgi:hypothetical protein